jgi:putative transposase
MVMAQLSGRISLRDIVGSVSAQVHRLYHPDSAKLTRSNLARMNESKPYSLYEALFAKLFRHCQHLAPGHQFRFKNKLYSLDASTIDLCLSVFPWTDFRSTKGAVKLHVGLNHSGYLLEFAVITDGKTSDVEAGRALTFPTGSIVAMDRGYIDYAWFNQLTNKGVYFVTRLKSNACYNVAGCHSIQKNKGLISDQTIMRISNSATKKCPIPLRRIVYRDQETGKQYTFLTNHFRLAARTIADIYKARCQVGLFFKWIKQNLKIKTFAGTSKNAVMTQIWIALCVYLLIAFIKFQSKIQISMQQISRLLHINLFEKRDLMVLLRGDPPDNYYKYDNQPALF